MTFDKIMGERVAPWWLGFKSRLGPAPPARAAHQSPGLFLRAFQELLHGYSD